MKITYTPNSRTTIELETRGEKVKDYVETMAEFHEVFAAASVCGKCKGTHIRLNHRRNDNHDYYEAVCVTPTASDRPCGAKLVLGQDQTTKSLFPRRYKVIKGEDGKTVKHVVDGKTQWLDHDGWVHWDNTKKEYV